MLDEENKIEIHNNFETEQIGKDTLISKLVEWLFYIFILFFIGFFIGTEIYQIHFWLPRINSNKNMLINNKLFEFYRTGNNLLL